MCDEVKAKKENQSMNIIPYISPHRRSKNVISAIPNIRKQLFAEGKKVKREKSLCFNYDEKWIKIQRCKGKLLLLSVDGSRLTEITHSNSDNSDDRGRYSGIVKTV